VRFYWANKGERIKSYQPGVWKLSFRRKFFLSIKSRVRPRIKKDKLRRFDTEMRDWRSWKNLLSLVLKSQILFHNCLVPSRCWILSAWHHSHHRDFKSPPTFMLGGCHAKFAFSNCLQPLHFLFPTQMNICIYPSKSLVWFLQRSSQIVLAVMYSLFCMRTTNLQKF
jgi:hypothetical protein